MGILFFINNFDIIKFDIQILINRMKGSSDLKIVFEFNSYPFAYKALEKGVKKLFFFVLKQVKLLKKRNSFEYELNHLCFFKIFLCFIKFVNFWWTRNKGGR